MKRKLTFLALCFFVVTTLWSQNGVTVSHYPFDNTTKTIQWDNIISTDIIETIAFDYGADGPSVDVTNNFATVLTGFISPTISGNYYFSMFHNDCYQYLLDSYGDGINNADTLDAVNEGDLIGQFWGEGQVTDSTDALDPIALEAGKYYEFSYIVVEIVGTTRGSLKWKLEGETDYVEISSSELFLEAGEEVGINNSIASSIFNVYPNPAINGKINIDLSASAGNVEISVIDIMGKLSYKNNFSSNEKFDLELNTGLYIIQATSNHKTYTQKLMVY